MHHLLEYDQWGSCHKNSISVPHSNVICHKIPTAQNLYNICLSQFMLDKSLKAPNTKNSPPWSLKEFLWHIFLILESKLHCSQIQLKLRKQKYQTNWIYIKVHGVIIVILVIKGTYLTVSWIPNRNQRKRNFLEMEFWFALIIFDADKRNNAEIQLVHITMYHQSFIIRKNAKISQKNQ